MKPKSPKDTVQTEKINASEKIDAKSRLGYFSEFVVAFEFHSPLQPLSQAWISFSLNVCRANEAGFANPLSHTSLSKVLYYGFKHILFSSSVFSNESDFPETLLFDTWALCSLQRKLRVDVSALCTASHVHGLFVDLGLDMTAPRDKAVACVVKHFLSVSYGELVRNAFG